MIAVSNNAISGNPIMTGKSDIFADLRALGVELSPSKPRKTTLAELQAMLDAKRAEIARERETRKAKRAASNKVVRLKPKAAPKPRAEGREPRAEARRSGQGVQGRLEARDHH